MDKQAIINEVQVLIKKIIENNLTFDTLQSLTELYPKGEIDVRIIEHDTIDIEIHAGVLTFFIMDNYIGRTEETHIINDIMLSHNAELETEKNGYIVPIELYIKEENNNNIIVNYAEDVLKG